MTQLTPAQDDITIGQGDTFVLDYTWKETAEGAAINLTGFTADLKVKARRGAAEAFIELDDEAGIELGGAAGTITITIADDVTEDLTFTRGYWRLKLTDAAGDTITLVEGTCTLEKK